MTSQIKVDSKSPRTMANAIRALSMDAVQAANSGHPGMPLGMADVATVLFTRFLKFDAAKPKWPDRDRFVLSAGHGSMLLYSLLHLTGHGRPTMDEIRDFRQINSPCAGHPEYGEIPGIETTTGPLGQGLGMAVGMALAERLNAARYGDGIVDHRTYVIVGDGCLMEGISHEVISMAGHMKLGKLCALWDDNAICIDGPTSMTVSDDQCARFTAAGWHVQACDGHDAEAIAAAIAAANEDPRPSMIACKTIIGYGAPNKQGTAATHGAPLGEEEIAGARKALDWPHAPFEIPEDIASAWAQAGKRAAGESTAWQARLDALDGDTRDKFTAAQEGVIPAALFEGIAALKRQLVAEPQKMATRKASQLALEVINEALDNTIGGSADLTGSVNTKTAQTGTITAGDFSGRYMYYGVREFGMSAVMNGMALHGGFIPYGGTFLVFADYSRPAIRLSALMGQRVIYVMTHDSIGLGEDGPTHQPVEHLASLRAIPGLNVFRPADAVETAEAWELALKDSGHPSIIALSRQGLAQVRLEDSDENLVARGGYILRPASGEAKVTLIATGSEVTLALAAQEILQAEGTPTRVVSMPSTGHFDAQTPEYRKDVLGENTLKVAVEAGVDQGWHKYIGAEGIFIGMNSFGASAPAGDLYKHFGITSDKIVQAVRQRLAD
ncbi:MAG: transketolase [Proteobacteria bacterium]|nr:transketolase [Pseudomonadota bacterium]